MKRREVLSVLTASGMVTGCLGGESSKTPDSTERNTTMSTASEKTENMPPEKDVISFEALQPEIVTYRTDTLAVTDDSYQYAYIRANFDAEDHPRREEFRFFFDGETYSPIVPDNLFRERIESGYNKYGEGWLLFQLPETGDASDAHITVRERTWRPSESLQNRLAVKQPRLEPSVSFPDTVEQGNTPVIEVTVENRGNVAGRFVCGVERSGPSVARKPISRVSEPIPPGEKTELEVADMTRIATVSDDELNDGEPDMRYWLEWAKEIREGAVRIVSDGGS